MNDKSRIKKPILNRLLILLFIAMFLQFFLTLGFNMAGFYIDLKSAINKTLNDKLEKLKNHLERILVLGVPLSEIPMFNNELEKETRGEFLLFIAVIDNQGKVVFHSDPIVIGSKFPVDQILLGSVKEFSVTLSRYNYINVVSKPVYDSKNIKAGQILAAYSSDYVYKKVFFVFLRMAFASILAVLLGAYLIFFFYKKQIEKPMGKLLAGLDNIRKGSMEGVEVSDPESEFGKIALSVNHMCKELNAIFNEKEELLEKLRHEEEKLRKIIERTEIGIAIVKDGKIVYVNPGFYKIFGIELKSSPIGKNIIDFFLPSEKPYYKAVFSEIIETGQKHLFDKTTLLDRENNEIYCAVEIALLETSEWGKNLLNLTFQNITERIRVLDELKNKNYELEQLIAKYQSTQLALQVSNEKLENALISLEKMNDELKKIDNTKDVFFSTITHELKTPISLVQGYMSILKSDAAIKNSAITLDIINAIERAGKRLAGLTEEIMELMKIRSGKLILNRTLTYIRLIINPVLGELAPLLDEKNMRVVQQNMDQLPLVNIDVKKMETVFRNLFINSIRFSKPEGTLFVSGKTTEDAGTKTLLLTIKDEGCGIDQLNIDKIFGEFFTMTPPQKLNKESGIRGSGLGLSIAKGIIEAHGGKISAESPGFDPETFPGTTFTIELPISE